MNGRKTNRFNYWPNRAALLVIAAVMAHVLIVPTAGATSICRWVDETGQVQFSDVVPERYKSIVSCTHSQPTELTTEQRAQAKKSQYLDDKSSTPRQTASAAAAPQIAPSQPVTKQPTETVTDSTDCKTWWRIYNESGACFAPFRTTLGGVKAEAFDKCNEVASPEEKCGSKSN